MCKRCDKVVQEMDILDTDLPNLPYILKKWKCWVPDCRGGKAVRDYGIAPFYWDPVKVKRLANGRWRGGWFEVTGHWYMCSRHYRELDAIGQSAFIEKYGLRKTDTEEYRISRIVDHKSNRK